MLKHYYVNTNSTANPNNNHEVHMEECVFLPSISSREYLGMFNSGVEAVNEAKKKYAKADGCAVCCPESHRE